MDRLNSIRFKNYKTFKSFSLTVKEFNVLVGPNNSGKSTILGAIRLLAEALRKARSRKPELLGFNGKTVRGYHINFQGLPVSTENVFTNYDDSQPAEIVFRLASGNSLTLGFETAESCCLIPEASHGVRTVSDFKNQFDFSITSVPVLGPVEANEPLYEKEAARLALLTHGASRNFRNIWYHYPEQFEEFRIWVQRTWPGMDIRKPEHTMRDGKVYLHMFCPEHRIDREIYWAGFGFQVWCQMLTFILQAGTSSLLIVDEPDIYLHSDLQRQLIRLLEGLGPAILLATHSTEIVSEVEPESILQINRRWKSAKRFSSSKQLNDIFLTLGSRLNPALTELAKTRVVLFLEGQDFKILSKFGTKLGLENVSSRSGFAILPSHGFNPQKVIALAEGMEISLGLSLSKAVIFDRDFRSAAEVAQIRGELEKKFDIVAIHSCKEIENFLLSLEPLTRAIQKRMKAQKRPDVFTSAQTASILDKVTASLKSDIFGQLCTRQKDFLRRTNRAVDESAIVSGIHTEFENSWKDLPRRLIIVPGKRVISLLNDHLQAEFSISVSATGIAESFEKEEIPVELAEILRKFEELCNRTSSDA